VKGSVYAQVNNLTETPDSEEVLLAFGRRAAGEIVAAPRADPFAVLPSKNRVPRSERIIRGPFTLERLLVLGEGDVLALEGKNTAYAAEYCEGTAASRTLIAAGYPSLKKARAAFDHVKGHLDPYLDVISQSEDTLVFEDYDGNRGEVKRDGAWIRIRLQPPESPGEE
jgi:hypothetical protein